MAAKRKTGTMPKWKPAPADLVATFERVAGGLSGVELRKMFGYPAAFVAGNMFTGLHEDRMILRLGEEDRTVLLREQGARIFEPMPGRPMREYVVVPEALLRSAPKLLGWLRSAEAYARTLPPKSSKKKP